MKYKRFKIKWKEYLKMMPFGERLGWLPKDFSQVLLY
jgi:hypothetical protein